MKIKISEANLSSAMKFVFDDMIKPLVERAGYNSDFLAYSPTSQKDTNWLKDNPATGKIYLRKHPNVKEAWVLVKFEMTSKNDDLISTNVATEHKTVHNKEEFKELFGVTPEFYPEDMVVTAKWNKQQSTRKRPRDFQETAPIFFMYVNHRKASLEKVIDRLYKINRIIEESGGTTGNLYKLPYNI